MNQKKSSVTVKNSIPLANRSDAGRRGANTKSICENIRNDPNSDREIKSAAYPLPQP